MCGLVMGAEPAIDEPPQILKEGTTIFLLFPLFISLSGLLQTSSCILFDLIVLNAIFCTPG